MTAPAPVRTDGPVPPRWDGGIRPGRGARAGRRGLWTVIGAFAICPCHLPLTLTLLGVALGGTVAGAFIRENALLAGTVITVAWAALTWRGLWLLRNADGCAVPGTAATRWTARIVPRRRER